MEKQTETTNNGDTKTTKVTKSKVEQKERTAKTDVQNRHITRVET